MSHYDDFEPLDEDFNGARAASGFFPFASAPPSPPSAPHGFVGHSSMFAPELGDDFNMLSSADFSTPAAAGGWSAAAAPMTSFPQATTTAAEPSAYPSGRTPRGLGAVSVSNLAVTGTQPATLRRAVASGATASSQAAHMDKIRVQDQSDLFKAIDADACHVVGNGIDTKRVFRITPAGFSLGRVSPQVDDLLNLFDSTYIFTLALTQGRNGGFITRSALFVFIRVTQNWWNWSSEKTKQESRIKRDNTASQHWRILFYFFRSTSPFQLLSLLYQQHYRLTPQRRQRLL
jgi:hypothetical protein